MSILNNSSITSIQWKEQLVDVLQTNYLHYGNLSRFLRKDSFKTKQTNICQESTSSQDTWCMFVAKIHWCRVSTAVWIRTQLSSSVLLKHVIIKLTVSFFFIFFEDISPVCGATDITYLQASSPVCNGFLRFTSGVTPADLFTAEPFWSTYLSMYTSIGGTVILTRSSFVMISKQFPQEARLLTTLKSASCSRGFNQSKQIRHFVSQLNNTMLLGLKHLESQRLKLVRTSLH